MLGSLLGIIRLFGLHRFGTLTLLSGLGFEYGVFGGIGIGLAIRLVGGDAIIGDLVLRWLWSKNFIALREYLRDGCLMYCFDEHQILGDPSRRIHAVRTISHLLPIALLQLSS